LNGSQEVSSFSVVAGCDAPKVLDHKTQNQKGQIRSIMTVPHNAGHTFNPGQISMKIPGSSKRKSTPCPLFTTREDIAESRELVDKIEAKQWRI
jgi:hypothetical protein